MESTNCPHPYTRLYSWWVGEDTTPQPQLVVCCCECGEVLRGAAEEEEEESL